MPQISEHRQSINPIINFKDAQRKINHKRGALQAWRTAHEVTSKALLSAMVFTLIRGAADISTRQHPYTSLPESGITEHVGSQPI